MGKDIVNYMSYDKVVECEGEMERDPSSSNIHKRVRDGLPGHQVDQVGLCLDNLEGFPDRDELELYKTGKVKKKGR